MAAGPGFGALMTASPVRPAKREVQMRFQDKVAFVTGGASGLGAAAAARFASEDARAVIADIDQDGALHPLHQLPAEEWRKVCAIDGDGVFHDMKYCVTEILKTGGGSIVNNSSIAGLTGQVNVSQYGFAKSGVVGLTRSAAIEYASYRSL